eukprot:scaffold1071_cov252-Pinguiococcus_pyrenoidosus.AAC.10
MHPILSETYRVGALMLSIVDFEVQRIQRLQNEREESEWAQEKTFADNGRNRYELESLMGGPENRQPTGAEEGERSGARTSIRCEAGSAALRRPVRAHQPGGEHQRGAEDDQEEPRGPPRLPAGPHLRRPARHDLRVSEETQHHRGQRECDGGTRHRREACPACALLEQHPDADGPAAPLQPQFPRRGQRAADELVVPSEAGRPPEGQKVVVGTEAELSRVCHPADVQPECGRSLQGPVRQHGRGADRHKVPASISRAAGAQGAGRSGGEPQHQRTECGDHGARPRPAQPHR